MNSGAKWVKTPPKSGFYSTTIFPGTRVCQSRETGILEITFSREIPGREIPGANTSKNVVNMGLRNLNQMLQHFPITNHAGALQ